MGLPVTTLRPIAAGAMPPKMTVQALLKQRAAAQQKQRARAAVVGAPTRDASGATNAMKRKAEPC